MWGVGSALEGCQWPIRRTCLVRVRRRRAQMLTRAHTSLRRAQMPTRAHTSLRRAHTHPRTSDPGLNPYTPTRFVSCVSQRSNS